MNTFYLPFRTCIVLLAVLCLNACKDKEETQPVSPITQPDTAQAFAVEDAYPGVECVWQDGMLNGVPIRYGIINGEAIFEGDIILTPEQLAPETSPNGRVSGAGSSEKIKRWQNFTIPYTIDPNLTRQNRVTDAIAHWEAKSPLRFVLRTTEKDYIKFTTGVGCGSELGRKGGEQKITLYTCPVPRPSDCGDCTTGTVIHEIGHAVGLFHEHNRSDRDKFVTFHKENVIPNDADQFIRYVDDGDLGFDFGAFDFNSIMLYPSDAYSDNGKSTLTRKDGSDYTAQRNGLSNGDVATVNAMYANLYIVRKGIFYAVNTAEGWGMPISDGWGTSFPMGKTIAGDERNLWSIWGDELYITDRLSGKSKHMGTGWTNAVGVTGIVGGTTRWAIKGKNLYAIDANGVRKDVDNFDWSNSSAIYAHKDFLFITDGNGILWKLDMNTGQWKDMGKGWKGTKAIAAATTGSNLYIYILHGSSLWQVNYNTGEYKQLGAAVWGGAENMVGFNEKLYIVSDDNLWEVDRDTGNRRALINGWGGIQAMGVIRNPGLLD